MWFKYRCILTGSLSGNGYITNYLPSSGIFNSDFTDDGSLAMNVVSSGDYSISNLDSNTIIISAVYDLAIQTQIYINQSCTYTEVRWVTLNRSKSTWWSQLFHTFLPYFLFANEQWKSSDCDFWLYIDRWSLIPISSEIYDCIEQWVIISNATYSELCCIKLSYFESAANKS